MTPTVSIVLPCYNGAGFLAQSIDSVIAQTFTDWELIIVNDCSKDNSLEIMQQYAEKDSRIRIINNEVNLTYPDGFDLMGEEELIRYFRTPADRWGVYNADKHIILSVNWKKAGFKYLFTDAESYIIEVEAFLHRNLLNYQRVTDYKMKIGKKKAYAIRFEYRVKDAALVQVCDLVAFKYKKHFYSVYYVTRKVNASANLPAFQEVLNSITLK